MRVTRCSTLPPARMLCRDAGIYERDGGVDSRSTAGARINWATAALAATNALCAAGHGGMVLVSEQTQKLVGGVAGCAYSGALAIPCASWHAHTHASLAMLTTP